MLIILGTNLNPHPQALFATRNPRPRAGMVSCVLRRIAVSYKMYMISFVRKDVAYHQKPYECIINQFNVVIHLC